jgi:hypothetical protein
MFPLSAERLPFLEIADFWSREIIPRASHKELLALLESAWWQGELKGNSALNRLQLLRKMFDARREPDMQSVVFVTPNDAGPPIENPLAGGGVVVDVRPRISVSAETDFWTENSCNDAFETLAGLPSQQYFPLLSYSICYIDLTYEEFFSWARTRRFNLPEFWKPCVVKGEQATEDGIEVTEIKSAKEAQESTQSRRRVSEAQAHKIFAKYRSECDGLPNRDEDAAFMKPYGFGREWVRAERQKYPRRKRGERITKTKSADQIGS